MTDNERPLRDIIKDLRGEMRAGFREVREEIKASPIACAASRSPRSASRTAGRRRYC
jgi:hypothetical protein